jgi:hypothetical protein
VQGNGEGAGMKLFGFQFGGDGYAFTITVPNPVEAVARARNAVVANGGVLYGTATGGTFSGRGVEGSYGAQMGMPNRFNVVITRKPWLVSYGYIERTVRSYFS